MTFSLLIAQLINGLQTGSVYALVALGYSMVYGIWSSEQGSTEDA